MDNDFFGVVRVIFLVAAVGIDDQNVKLRIWRK